jgi:hypothetical protein
MAAGRTLERQTRLLVLVIDHRDRALAFRETQGPFSPSPLLLPRAVYGSA